MKRTKASVFVFITATALSGCVTSNGPAAPNSATPKQDVVCAATRLRAQERGRTAGFGGGQSMAPLYGENTVLVIHPVPYDDLEPGMNVAYWGKNGARVVHELLRRDGDRWIAIGINNACEDRTRVTRDNYIGVVYGVFNAQEE